MAQWRACTSTGRPSSLPTQALGPTSSTHDPGQVQSRQMQPVSCTCVLPAASGTSQALAFICEHALHIAIRVYICKKMTSHMYVARSRPSAKYGPNMDSKGQTQGPSPSAKVARSLPSSQKGQTQRPSAQRKSGKVSAALTVLVATAHCPATAKGQAVGCIAILTRNPRPNLERH